MAPKLSFPALNEHPSRSRDVVAIKRKSYGSSGDQSHCVPSASGFQCGRYTDRASPLSRPATGWQGPLVFTPTRVVLSPSPEQQLMVYQLLAASVGRSVFHLSITSPAWVNESQTWDPASSRAVSRLFTTWPRSFSAPVQGSSAVDLSDNGCMPCMGGSLLPPFAPGDNSVSRMSGSC